MAVQQITFIREGKKYTEHIGIDDANGQSVHYIDEAEPDTETGQPVRWVPESTAITRDEAGGVAQIETTWQRYLVGVNGGIIRSTGQQRRMHSNYEDILYFVAGFGMPIMMSQSNGWTRAIRGFNDLPQWDALTGQPVTYTPEQEAEPPTNDYYNQPNE